MATEGNSTGSLHPLVSVNEATKGADHFANAYFCIEGDETALGLANSVATRLGGIPFTIRPTEKALYHAAAVTACGHLVALIDVATEMLSKCGIERRRAQEILLPLISTTVRNLESSSPAEALTGSFARMDIDAVRRHLAAIDDASLSPAVWAVYITLGERSLDLAEANGAEASEVAGLRDFISMAKRKCG